MRRRQILVLLSIALWSLLLLYRLPDSPSCWGSQIGLFDPKDLLILWRCVYGGLSMVTVGIEDLDCW